MRSRVGCTLRKTVRKAIDADGAEFTYTRLAPLKPRLVHFRSWRLTADQDARRRLELDHGRPFQQQNVGAGAAGANLLEQQIKRIHALKMGR